MTPAATSAASTTTKRRKPRRRAYVLDTSVLLADPAAITRFAEHDVVLPVVVITELEAKRNHPELGWFARQALHLLDDLRAKHGRLDAPLPVNDAGGRVRVELNHSDPSILPPGYRQTDNDSRILTVAGNLAAEGEDVVLVSKDMPLRIKAASIGLAAEEYLAEQVESGWTGMAEIDVSGDEVDALYADGDARPRAGARTAVPHRRRPAVGTRQRARAGGRRQDTASWSAVIATRSAFTAAAPSSGSRSTCCSILRSASSRSVAGPGRASRRWRCAPASRRCSSAASTRRSWCSARCTPSAARSSATCRAAKPRRCRRGRRRCSTPSARWSARR